MMRGARMTLAGMCAAALWLAAARVQAAGPAVAALDAASADAQVVVVIPQMADASRKLAGWMTAAGLPLSPQMQDLLGDMKREMGIEAGLNDSGASLIVIQNLAAPQQEPAAEPDIILVMAVSDYAAFVGNFGGQGEGVTELTLKDGSAGYAKKVGDFAVMAEDRAVVEAYEPANSGGAIASKLGPGGATALDRSDAAIYLDIEKAGPQLKHWLHEGTSGALATLAATGVPNVAAAQQGMQLYADAADAVLDGSTAMVLGLDISDAGVGLNKAIRIKRDSAIAAYFPGGKGNAAAELARLPRQPYVFAAAVDGKAIDLGKLYVKLGEADDADAMRKMMGPAVEEIVAMGKSMKAVSFAFYAPDEAAMMAGSMLNMLGVITADDGEAYAGLVQAYVEKLNGASVPIDPNQPDGPAITYNATYTPGALDLGGVSVDQFLIQTNMPMELMQQMGPAAGLMQAFSSSRGYLAAQGKYVVATTGADPQIINAALAASEAGDGIGSDGAIPELRKTALPASPGLEMYLDLGGIAAFANPFVTMFGGAPITIPADLPPVAIAMTVDGDTLVGRMYVPTPAVQFTVNAFNQLQAMQNQGGPPTRPGGPAPY